MSEPPDVTSELAARLRDATEQLLGGGGRSTILFSGGLDSTVLAWFARDAPAVELLTVGRPGSPDLVAGETAAALLGLPWRAHVVDDEALESGLQRWSPTLAALPEPRRSVLWSLAFAFAACGASRVLLGQGADELFGGYAHFEGLAAHEAVRRSDSDWRRLVDEDWPATRALAGEVGVSVSSPYLDERVAGFVRALPVEGRGFGGERKALLRAVGRWVGVPESLVMRPKRAMQYGTRIAKEVRRLSVSSESGPEPRSGSRPPPAAPGAAREHR